MGNPLQIYVGDIPQIVAQMRAGNHSSLRNLMPPPWDTDYVILDLADFVNAARSSLSQQQMHFLCTIASSYISGASDYININNEEDHDRLGIQIIVDAEALAAIDPASMDVTDLARRLYRPSDIWESESELAEYLSIWRQAYVAALADHHGVVVAVSV